ncbi:MAG: Hpt domain-containing protein, partial [Alphaproteobacteria bacterium]|nr:Hpt domain-containing protein [Alphaproteobacteria bacterium]
RQADGLPDIPGLNWAEALERTDGNKDLLLDLLTTFVDSFETMPANLRDAFAAGHLDVVHREAHGMKSAAGYIGATEMRAIAERLEHAAAEGDANAIAPLFHAFLDELERLLAALDKTRTPA